MTPLLVAKDIVAGYQPDLPILHGVSMEVTKGEVVTIIGPNGAGKSTLAKAIAGLVHVTSGDVWVDGTIATNVAAHQMAGAGVGFVPQTANVFTTLTIEENLVVGGAALAKPAANRQIERVFGLYPILADRRGDKAGVLSGGQRQILAIGRALLTEPKLLLLDEPTAGLSPKAAAEMFATIREIATDGSGVLMVEQNAKAALRMSDRGYVLAEGENRIDGPSSSLLDNKEIGAIFLGARPDDLLPVNQRNDP
ncbi:MAG: ATP-binding cassette domain-containing protein [Rhizobiaceae bacterium]|nr:ATP-binding cassette domain-containing protein [Rhizobiaceae bacterium]